ncbi:MAG: hypothetical protein ACTSQI_14260 [Candidatus Helarchaeota archaeon]
MKRTEIGHGVFYAIEGDTLKIEVDLTADYGKDKNHNSIIFKTTKGSRSIQLKCKKLKVTVQIHDG